MKTIYTSLPIYDSISKQCYERGKHGGVDKPVPIICPRHRLPSWQYNVEATVVGAVTRIDLVDIDGNLTNITTYFPVLSDDYVLITDTYYKYDGDTLNYLLIAGIYYLKITHANGYIYWSEWFMVDCVYLNLITTWVNISYDTFTKNDTVITSAIETGVALPGQARSDYFTLSPLEMIMIIFYHTQNSDQLPELYLWDSGGAIDHHTAIAGLNVIFLTAVTGGTCHLTFDNSAATNFLTTEIYVIRSYSTKYLTINYYNDCDLGDILYQDGFEQTIWFESETMETTFPQDEEGMKNGEGRFVRSFARQTKKYIARTKEMPDFMVEVFNRMKLHDTVELTDLVGNVNDIYNLEVEHEWLWNDKYYVKIDLTFDYNEAFVIAGCCNNLT
jgi:hypothetical protein